jgi:hypothetical protein
VRNVSVERAVDLIIQLLDRLSKGDSLGSPTPAAIKDIFDKHTEPFGGSVRLACVFLTAYAVVDPRWSFRSVPTGTRGAYGDKRLAGELTLRNVTFHKSITAFGENLGWKGAVKQFDLSKDHRFAPFVAELQKLNPANRASLLNHIAWRLHASRVVPQALPPLPRTYLAYAKSLDLCEKLLAIPSEGHIQQFLVAAFLEVHRKRFGNRVATHHPHASDKSDGTVGDIEEYRDDTLVAAYEVTVRSDWKNRLADFGKKATQGKLPKYVIFAAGVRSDPDLFPACRLIEFVDRLSFDLAVVDTVDFFTVFCAELQRDEIGLAINRAYQMLSDPRLSGREDLLVKYRAETDRWLDE